jgi:hypothetical protein
MSNVFFVLMILAALAVFASLFLGVLVMAKGGETSKKYSNRLMQARVLLQGLAILLFIFAVLASR